MPPALPTEAPPVCLHQPCRPNSCWLLGLNHTVLLRLNIKFSVVSLTRGMESSEGSPGSHHPGVYQSKPQLRVAVISSGNGAAAGQKREALAAELGSSAAPLPGDLSPAGGEPHNAPPMAKRQRLELP